MNSPNATENGAYDSFYSPANDAFYMASPYSPLNRSRREIRLLKVSLRADVQPHLQSHIPTIDQYLECHIQNTTSLSRAAGEYCALSYVAGSPTETAPIPINGVMFNAFANLKHAIVHACYHWKVAYPDRDLLLWADQICIDQSNKEERGHQVGLMRDIYYRSKRTFICVSNPRIVDCLSWVPRPGSSETVSTALVKESPVVLLLKKALINFLIGEQEGAELLQDINSPGLQDSASALSTSDQSTETEAALQGSSMNMQLSQLIRRSRNQADSSTINMNGSAKGPERKEYMPKDSTVFQNSIRAFLINVYWRRAWIYQEFISSSEVHFVSGDICISWPELLPLMAFLQTGLDPLLDSMRQFSQRRKDDDVTKLEAEGRLRKEKREKKMEERRHQHEIDVETKKQELYRQQQNAARQAEKQRIHQAIVDKDIADQEKRRRIEDSNLREQQTKAWESVWKIKWQEQEKRRKQFHSQQLSDIWREANKNRSLLKVLNAFREEAMLSIDQQIVGLWEQNGTRRSRSLYSIDSFLEESVRSEILKTASLSLSLSPIDYLKFPKPEERFRERLRRRKFASERVRRLLELHNVPSNPGTSQHNVLFNQGSQFAHTTDITHNYENRQIIESDGEGYDRNGYNLAGHDRSWRDRSRRYRNGHDPAEPNYDRNGYDPLGYNRDGYNPLGYNRDGFDRNWFPRPEIDPDLDPDPAAIPSARQLWDTRTASIEQLQDQFRNLDASALWSMIQGKRTIRRRTDLISLLQHSRNCDSSDLRDRVYAFLGLALTDYAIFPKYDSTSTIATVLIETAEAIIRAHESLDILGHVQHERHKLGCELPTWVPDWTSRGENSDIQKLLSITHNAQNRAFSAAKDTKAIIEFRRHSSDPSHVDMRIRGVFIDFLDRQDEAAEGSSEVLVFSTVDGQAVIAPSKARVDDEVWVVYGANKPVLLRPEGPDTYSFLGHVFVCDREKMEESGVMFGEAVGGRHKAKDVWIV